MMSRDILNKIADTISHYEKEKNFWLEQMSGELIKTGFPYDHNKTMENQKKEEKDLTRAIQFEITGTPFEQLMRLSKRNDYTLHVILTAALAILLAKYTGEQDIIVGSPIYKQETDAKFVNTVVALRNQVKSRDSFKKLLLQVKNTVVAADKNQNYPIEKLAEDLNPDFSSNDDDFPLFDVTLLLENIHDREYIRHISHSVTFSFLKTDDNIKGNAAYRADRYEKATIQRIIGHFMNLLQQVLDYPDIKAADIDILSRLEKKQLLFDYNQTGIVSSNGVDGSPPVAVHELFEQQVEQTPDHIALTSVGTRSIASDTPNRTMDVTYCELNRKSNRLAHMLRQKGVHPDIVVGIMAERSPAMIAAILGVLKAGGAYLPISPDIPPARKKFMLEDSGANLLLLQEHLPEENGDIMDFLSQQHLFFLDPPDSHLKEIPEQQVLSNPRAPVKPHHLGYVIYTSGSTGRPKGVLLEHRGIVNYVRWAAKKYVQNSPRNFPLYTSFSFDLTVTSIFIPLVTGNAIVIYPENQGEPLIKQVIEDNRVGMVKLTPSHLRLVVSGQVDVSNSQIKGFIVGGENLDTQLSHEITRLFNGNINIYNEYGPTETVVGSMIYQFDPAVDRGESVPIGIPIANTQIYLLDRDKNPVPIGVIGELYISGSGVARGYLNRPELTAEKFLTVFNRSYMSHRSYIYRTGDLARWLPDGNIEFLGRKDQQVKIRAFRIELGEIENKLMAYRKHPPITHSPQETKVTGVNHHSLCKTCLLPANYPGIRFDNSGVCNTCREYERYKTKVDRYFKEDLDFHRLIADIKKNNRGKYDCLLLFSGGKDSSYVLYQLIDMGLNVLTFTFDNGYISAAAFANIKRITSKVGVENIVYRAENIDRLFVESLNTNHNVCHGCWHALNTFGAKVAHEKEINLVISGLSRGQIFDMRLLGLFQQGIFAEKEIEENLLLFRKTYHSKNNRFSQILGMDLAKDVVEQIRFVDFFRYFNTPVVKIKEYLSKKGWVQPGDTGFCSSNCTINDVGIYIHLEKEGYHFYSAPLSWDCRLGSITREEGLQEIGFEYNLHQVDHILEEIGYYNSPIKDAVVIDKEDKNGDKYLCAYIVSTEEPVVPDLKGYLAKELPPYMVPSYFVRLEQLPLTPSGKINRKALPEPGIKPGDMGMVIAPTNEREEKLTRIWAEILGIKKEVISIDANFFDLGGHSFNLTLMAGKIQQEFNIALPLGEIFKTPNIKGIATLIEMLAWASGQNREVNKNQKKEEIIL
ncbi:amino acid adenylation domain-containing protein [Acidobacteriota bacterium]